MFAVEHFFLEEKMNFLLISFFLRRTVEFLIDFIFQLAFHKHLIPFK